MKNIWILIFFLLINGNTTAQNFTINPQVKHQEMIGFGGALTWYSDRITRSSDKDAIYDLMFQDLGLDIFRLKNWYYPLNYPAYKGVDDFEESWFRGNFETTQEFYAAAKLANPNTKIILSSWSPSSGLKSNDNLSGGTLKKKNDDFVYSEFAQYFEDVLDNLGFIPDYLSIQNEPAYIDTWTTCEWRPTETDDFPGYDIAFDSVYQRIKNRTNPPLMIGAEVANIGNAHWDNSLNTFRAFTNPIKNNEGLHAYAYHVYNYLLPSFIESRKDLLNILKNEFNDKPNIMTEFSKEKWDWNDMAKMIQNTLIEANTSGFVYWKLAWDSESDDTMIAIDESGNYTLTNFYYLIKHFSKFVDEGDDRIDMIGHSNDVKGTAFLTNEGDSVTIVLTNNASREKTINLNFTSGFLSNIVAYRTDENRLFQREDLPYINSILLPKKSIITIRAAIEDIENTTILELELFPNPVKNILHLRHYNPNYQWKIYSIDGRMLLEGQTDTINVSYLPQGMYILKTGTQQKKFIIGI